MMGEISLETFSHIKYGKLMIYLSDWQSNRDIKSRDVSKTRLFSKLHSMICSFI